MEVVTPSKVCFPLIYIFFEVMLMSEVDGIRSCFEDYILLFLFDVCIYVCIYVWPLLVEYSVIVIFHVIFFMCCLVIVNYFGKKNSIKRKQGVNNCFKPLISSVYTTIASRLNSKQKEKGK